MKTREQQVGHMEGRLQHWGAKLDRLAARFEVAGDHATAEHRARMAALKDKHQLVRRKLDELEAATASEWETFWSGVESAWEDLVGTFKEARVATAPRARSR